MSVSNVSQQAKPSFSSLLTALNQAYGRGIFPNRTRIAEIVRQGLEMTHQQPLIVTPAEYEFYKRASVVYGSHTKVGDVARATVAAEEGVREFEAEAQATGEEYRRKTALERSSMVAGRDYRNLNKQMNQGSKALKWLAERVDSLLLSRIKKSNPFESFEIFKQYRRETLALYGKVNKTLKRHQAAQASIAVESLFKSNTAFSKANRSFKKYGNYLIYKGKKVASKTASRVGAAVSKIRARFSKPVTVASTPVVIAPRKKNVIQRHPVLAVLAGATVAAAVGIYCKPEVLGMARDQMNRVATWVSSKFQSRTSG